MARRSAAAAAGAGAGKADNKKPQVSLRILFANHDDVKPLELAVPLSTTVGGLKDRLCTQWPEGLPTQQQQDGGDPSSSSSTVIAATPATPDPKQELQQQRRRRRRASSGPVEPQTPLSVASSSPSAASPSPAAPAESGAATDDEEEEEEDDEEEEGVALTPPPVNPAALRVAVEPERIRLVCLGRGLDDDAKTLSQYHIPSFEYPTPVQCMIRPASAVRGGGAGARRSPKSLEEGHEGEEDAVGPLGCCGCSVM